MSLADTPVMSGKLIGVGGVSPTGLNFPDVTVMSGKLEPASRAPRGPGRGREEESGVGPSRR
jgi:hypothetical protein